MKVSDFHENYGKGYRLFFAAMRYHPLVGWEKPFDRGHAWEWLIFEACGKKEGREVQRNFGGKIRMIREEYGQVTHSERFIAEAWGWTRQRVSTFLRQLSNTKNAMIAQNVSQQISQITICNFEDYQRPKASKYSSSKPAVSQQQASSKPNYITVKRNNDITYTVAFENFWKLYPKKLGKGKAFEKWKSLKIERNGLLEKVMDSVVNEVPLRAVRGEVRYVQNPATWLNASGWEDEPPEFKKQVSTKSARELAIDRGLHKPK